MFTWAAILIAGVAALVCALFFILRWSINAYYVSEAGKGIYHPGLEKTLTLLNEPEGYIVWYNLGNYYYEEGRYKEAEIAYSKAIKCGIPYESECPVKVNLALSMLYRLSDEEWEAFLDCEGPDDINAQSRKVEKTLLEARDILTEDGCAHEDDEDGHDRAAQTLKDEIDELLENSSLPQDSDDQEEDQDSSGDQDSDDNDDGDEDDSEDDPSDGDDGMNEDEIMEHIMDQLDENQEQRTDLQQMYENYFDEGTEDGGSGSEEEQGEVW